MDKERYRTNMRIQDELHVLRHNPDRSRFLDPEDSTCVGRKYDWIRTTQWIERYITRLAKHTTIETDKMQMFSLSHTRTHQ